MEKIKYMKVLDIVYPGHPLLISICVFDNFNNALEALSLGKNNIPNLVGSNKVPGSGDGAWACYRMLKSIFEGKLNPEEAIFWANGFWINLVGPGTGNFEDRLKPGLDQAHIFSGIFLDKAKSWNWNKQQIYRTKIKKL